ncbi:MAG TPA: phospholipase D family protein, partial [Planctomycetaceae bacterium]|nr:phospholipase D family protein [Planctomycetaceae bacterium]
RPIPDPIALLKAVRQYADRMCIFYHVGRIHVPKAYQPLLQSLENSVVEAIAPRGGSFHPKVWFLRYVADDDPEKIRYRFLCLSRNMTFDRAWDTMLCLDGELLDRRNAIAMNHPLGRFVESLPSMSVRGLTKTWKDRVDQLAKDIRRVAFEVPDPFDEVAFWPIGIDENEDWPFEGMDGRKLVISPFVSAGIFGELIGKSHNIDLVSRADQLELIEHDALQAFQKTWILDDAATPEPGDIEQDDTSEKDLSLSGLHAKVFVMDEGWDASVFTGSANATHAAFYKNVEFLTQLRGKKSVCGVDAVLGRSADADDGNSGSKKSGASLADLLRPFKPQPDDVCSDTTEKKFEQFVDDIAKAIAASLIVAKCLEHSDTDCYQIQLEPGSTKKPDLPVGDAFDLSVRLASTPNASPTLVNLNEPVWAVFPSVSLMGMTSFFVFEVVSKEAHGFRRSFVLNLPLIGEPETRKESLLRSLLSDRGRMMRFLLMLLAGDAGGGFGEWPGTKTGDGKSFTMGTSLDGKTLFESLMRCLDQNPAGLQSVQELLSDLEQSAEGKALLPEDFDSIWKPIWEIAQEQLGLSSDGAKS